MNYKKGTQTRGCMKSVMRYVSQMSKTLWGGQQLVSGIGCQPETAFDEFLSTKLLHHKDGGVMFYHMVQSFPKGADVDPRTAHEAARQLAGYFEGCEILVCTHVDREHIHSHCIINSVNFETGKKVHIADKQIQALRVRNDQICEELGLPKFQKDEQWQSRGMSNAEYYTAVKGESWKFELMRVIDECIRYARNREEFLALLRAEGYTANWSPTRKNITYITPDGCKCRDSRLHMTKYRKENMEAHGICLHIRHSDLTVKEFMAVPSDPVQSSKYLAIEGMRLLRKNWDGEPLRSIGIRAIKLQPYAPECQLSFFDEREKIIKEDILERSVDKIRDRYGSKAVVRAALMNDFKGFKDQSPTTLGHFRH